MPKRYSALRRAALVVLFSLAGAALAALYRPYQYRDLRNVVERSTYAAWEAVPEHVDYRFHNRRGDWAWRRAYAFFDAEAYRSRILKGAAAGAGAALVLLVVAGAGGTLEDRRSRHEPRGQIALGGEAGAE